MVSLGIASGPSAGGLLLNWSGWHSIFLINVPLGIIASFLVARLVPASIRSPGKQKFDPFGALLALLTLGSFGLGMTLGQSQGFTSMNALVLLSIAALSFATFLIVELIIEQPLLELNLFRNFQLSMSLLSGLLVSIVLGGGLLITPFFLEQVKHYPIAKVGLLMAVSPVLTGLTAPVAGRLADRFNPQLINSIGLGLMIGGCLGISSFDAQITELDYVSRYLFYGVGLGLFLSPNNSTVMGSVPRNRLGIASGLLSLSRTAGNTVGVSLIGAIFGGLVASVAAGADVSVAPPEAIVVGFQGTFRFAALILSLGAIASVSRLNNLRFWTALSPTWRGFFRFTRQPKIPTYYLQAFRSFLQLSKNPRDLKALDDLDKGLSRTDTYRVSREYIKSHPDVWQIVQERYLAPKPDLDALLNYSTDSLGYAYALYMKKSGLNPELDQPIEILDDNNYIRLRLRQTHHIHHIITGFENDLAGEVGLHAFYLAQTRAPLSVAAIAIGIVYTLHSKEDLHTIIARIHQGWNMGLQAKPLLAQKWEENWQQPLSSLRTELGLKAVMSKHSLSLLKNSGSNTDGW